MNKELKELELEPNTLVGRIHINHDNHEREEFQEFIRELLSDSDNNELPSGYSLFNGEGGWFPDSEDIEDEIEPKSLLEVWIDSKSELEAVRELKTIIENEFNQHCCCLELERMRIEH